MPDSDLPIRQDGDFLLLSYADCVLKGITPEDLCDMLANYLEGRFDSHLIVTLEDVDFLSSAALGTLLKVRNGLERGGGVLCLAHPTRKIKELLRITALEKKFMIRETVDVARADLPSRKK